VPTGQVKDGAKCKMMPKRKTKRLSVRFEQYPELWELLVNNAYDNCRSLNSEVVNCVREQYKFEQEAKEWEKKL